MKNFTRSPLRFSVLTICVYISATLGCLNPVAAENSTRSPDGLEPVVFCRPNNMISSFLYLADFKGFFREEGLAPTFETTTNAKICQDLLIAGKVEMMTGGEGPFTYLAATNPPVRIVAMLQRSPETSVFARVDRGIKSFSDLKGKRVAYLPGTSSTFFLSRALKKAGLSRTDVHLTPMQPPAMSQALVGGAVDAFSMWEPWGSQALERLGDNGINLADLSTYQYEAFLLARTDFLKSKPEVTFKVLRALLKAESFVQNNSEEAFSLLQKAIVFPEPVFRRLWPQYVQKVRIEDGPLQLMRENFAILQADDENFKGVPTPNFNALVDPSFLQKVAPERVTFGEKDTTVQAASADIVTFCRFPSMLSTLPVIAEEQGFFRAHGITVQFHDVLNGKICQDELVAQRVDFAALADGPFAYLSASPHPLKVIAVLEEGQGVMVVGRKDKGISDFSSLKGKRVAFLPGTLSALLLYRIFDGFNWSRSDIKLTALQPPVMVQALQGGHVDAVSIWEPWIGNAIRAAGDQAVKLPARDIFRYYSLLEVHEKTLIERRVAVQHVLEALLETERFVQSHKERAIQTMASFLKIPESDVAAAWDDYTVRISLTDKVLGSLNRNFDLIRRYEQDFESATTPNFKQAIDPNVLRIVASDRVELSW